MEVEFDPAKDAANVVKHGVSLARAADLEVETLIDDPREYAGEVRRWAFGLLDGAPYCLSYILRGGVVRAISLRRAHQKEYRRHVR